LRRAIDFVPSRPEVDPRRLGYVGHSFGAMFGGILAGVESRVAGFALMAGVGSFADVAALNIPTLQGEALDEYRRGIAPSIRSTSSLVRRRRRCSFSSRARTCFHTRTTRLRGGRQRAQTGLVVSGRSLLDQCCRTGRPAEVAASHGARGPLTRSEPVVTVSPISLV
jgi:hypothetical protein